MKFHTKEVKEYPKYSKETQVYLDIHLGTDNHTVYEILTFYMKLHKSQLAARSLAVLVLSSQ